MTRGTIKERAFQRCGLTLGDDVFGDPYAVDNALNMVCDTFAGPGMDCYWTSETTDLVSGTAEYCAPQFYKIKSVLWLDSIGNWNCLMPISVADMDRLSFNWRNIDPQSALTYAVFEGCNRITLYPKPNFNQAGGLKIEGYANTNASGISTWATEASECPLPSWCHDAVAYGLAVELDNMMLASDDPRLVARGTRLLPVHMKTYRDLRGSAEKAADEYYTRAVKPFIPAWWARWSW